MMKIPCWQQLMNVSNTNQEWYVYDASGNRVLKRSTNGSGTTMTVYAFGLEDHLYSGTGTNQANTYYYFLGGQLIGTLNANGTYFLLTDALGSIVSTISWSVNSAAAQGNQLFGPYGSPRYYAGNSTTTRGFTGQYNDALTTLDYFNARYYDPVAGVFLSADLVQGNATGMNPYGYVGGNPETYADPTGREYIDFNRDLGGGEVETKAVLKGARRVAVGGRIPCRMWGDASPGKAGENNSSYAENGVPAEGGDNGFNDLGIDPINHGDMNSGETPQDRIEEPQKPEPTNSEPKPTKTASHPDSSTPQDVADAAQAARAGNKGAKSNLGRGTIFSHFTDANGVNGITGVDPESLALGQTASVNQLSFGQGTNAFMANEPGDIFVTELGADATPRQLAQIGIFGEKQSFVIQFSQEAAVMNDIIPFAVDAGRSIFTIPGGSELTGFDFLVTRLR
jgi:RHS repeat-associated protein